MYIVIAGGGKIGSYLASILLKSGNEVAVIEQKLTTADRLSMQLEGRYLVIHGDGCDSRYQEDAGIRGADVFVATTGQDDSNLVSCEIAQRVFHVPRCIARVNNPKNERIFREVGVECVSSTTLIANLIEEEALLGSVSVVSSLTHGNVALAEVVVPRMRHFSDEDGVLVEEIPLPDNALIAAVSSGGDVEVANAIADKLGVKAVFAEGEWDALLAGLESGRFDIMVNGVDVDEERQKKYDFSDPYAYNRTAVIVRADDDSIQSMEDLAGKHTANTISSTYATVAESYGAEVTGVDDLAQTFELLLTGRIDATLNAEATYYDYMKAHPDAPIKVACLDSASTQAAIPMRKGEEPLVEAVNQALAELREDGTLTELSEKYFGTDISQEK